MKTVLKLALTSASLAYLNARLQFGYDVKLLKSLGSSRITMIIRERRDSVSLFYILEYWAQSSRQNTPFIVYEGREYTYKQVYEIALKYGTWFKEKLGVKPKEIVAIDCMNSDVFCFLWLGLWSIGAQPAFINYNLTGKPLLHCLKTSTARVVIVDPEVKSEFTPDVLDELAKPDFRGEGQGGTEVLYFDSDVQREVEATQGKRESDQCRSGILNKDMAALIYTSGTTGLPKPAIVSWAKCALAPGFVMRWMGLKQSDRFYTCMPLYHSSAAVLGFCTTLQNGSAFCIGRKFSTKTFWNDVRRCDASIIQYVGETCRYLLAAEPQLDPVTGENMDKQNNVRVAFGNGLRPDVWNKFKDRFGIETIGEFYAATEGTSGSWNLSRNDLSRGAIGRNGVVANVVLSRMATIVNVDPLTEVPYRDPATGFCTKTPQGEAGELLYKLDAANIEATFQGYFGNNEATQKKIMRDVYVKGDAWFRTGDMVRWDGGLWFFNDRLGDTFRWKSENVSTSEVSQVLGLHPAVQEANVYGVELPNHDGRAGCVAIVLKEEPSPKVLESIAQYAEQNLPKFAVPLFLRMAKDMATTGTNKQQKQALRLEGVDPAKTAGDDVFWLRGHAYVPFAKKEWELINGGRVRL